MKIRSAWNTTIVAAAFGLGLSFGCAGDDGGDAGETSGTESLDEADAEGDGDGDPCEGVPGDMVCVPGGTFTNVDGQIVVESFWLDKLEVTVRDYRSCVDAGGCTAPSGAGDGCNYGVAGRDQHPVNCVDHGQARAFCAWAERRLPTDPEWEWAARGRGEGRRFPWGDQAASCARAVMDDQGDGCGQGSTAAVGTKPDGESRDGIFDLAGNVAEWTDSFFRVQVSARGGSWRDDAASERLETANRFLSVPEIANDRIGLRCAATPGG